MSEEIAAALAEMGVTDSPAPTVPEPVTASADEIRNPDGTFKARESTASDEPAEEAAADTGESDESDEQAEAEQPKPKSRVTDRIAALTAQRNEARARAESLQQSLNKYQPQAIDPELEFSDPGQYTAAVIKQALAEQKAVDTQEQAQQAFVEQRKTSAEMFYARASEMAAEMPDFEQVFNRQDLPIGEVAIEFLSESEVGPRIAYHLGKNQALALHINSLNPVAQGIELARLEAKLSAPPAKRTTKAPSPAPTISGARASGGQFDPQSASVDDFARQIYGKG